MTEIRRQNITRNDVAKRAGVSPAVVSYVLNNSKYVSDERRKAVWEAVEELGYQPNMMARGLKTKKSMQIAFVCDNLRNDWLEGAEELLFKKGYYVCHCYSKPGMDFINMLRMRRFDGIFMMSNLFSTEELNFLAKNDIPVILYKTREYGELDSRIATLVPNYFDVVSKSVHYLAMKGHKRIAMIPPIRYKTTGLGGNDFRIKAYEQAMRESGLELRKELICTNTATLETIKSSVFDMVCRKEEDRPTAIIAGDDYLAINIIQYIKQIGKKIPGDIAVMGADNTFFAPAVTPALTSVDFSKEEFSEKLADMMIDMIDGKKGRNIYLDVSIVVREST